MYGVTPSTFFIVHLLAQSIMRSAEGIVGKPSCWMMGIVMILRARLQEDKGTKEE